MNEKQRKSKREREREREKERKIHDDDDDDLCGQGIPTIRARFIVSGKTRNLEKKESNT